MSRKNVSIRASAAFGDGIPRDLISSFGIIWSLFARLRRNLIFGSSFSHSIELQSIPPRFIHALIFQKNSARRFKYSLLSLVSHTFIARTRCHISPSSWATFAPTQKLSTITFSAGIQYASIRVRVFWAIDFSLLVLSFATILATNISRRTH